MSFLGEVRRRNVFKVGAAYLIVAWLLIQIAVAVFPVLQLPEWGVPFVTILLLLGFPVALVLAWAYELTPEGIKPTKHVPFGDSVSHITGRRLNFVVSGLLLVALVYVVVDAYVLTDDVDSEPRTVLTPPPPPAVAAPSAGPVTRTSINPSRGESWVISPHDPDFAIAPDGQRIAYIGRRGNANHVVVRRLDEFEGRSLGSFGGVVRDPFFSPDGQWIGFTDGNALKKVNVRDATAATIATLPGYTTGASWGAGDTIVFGTLNSGLFTVSAAGGQPSPLETAARTERRSPRWPYFLPDGRALLYAAVNARGDSEVRVLSLDGGDDRVLVEHATFPRYASSGHLIYVADGVLWAAAFDPKEFVLVGTPVPIVDGVMIKGPRQTGLGAANVGVADNGTLVYRAVGPEGSGTSTLVWVDRDGREETLRFAPQLYGRLQLSRDGSKIAIELTDPNLTNTDIWVGEVSGSSLRRLTFDPAVDDYPIWTTDAKRVAFRSGRDNGGLFLRSADGSGRVQRLVSSEFGTQPYFELPDRSGLVFAASRAGSPFAFYSVSVDGDHVPMKLDLHNGFVAAISADGKWFAYSSDESGNFEIYVQPYPNPDQEKWRITSNGGRDPVWSADGSELYYQNDTTVYASAVTTEPAFAAAPGVPLFDGPYIDSLGRWYDVAPDGRFLMVKPGWLSAARDTPLNVVLNWYEELRQAAPANRR